MSDDMLLTAAHFSAVVAASEPGSGGLVAARLPLIPRLDRIAAVPSPAPRIKPLPQAVAELEAGPIRDALVATGGNKLAASRLLGISRVTLYQRLPRAQHGPDRVFDQLNDVHAPESVPE